MSSASLFSKLQEHEIELERLEKHEENKKNSRTISLKTKIKCYDDNQKDVSQSISDEDDALIKKFEIFLRKELIKEISSKKVLSRKVTWFECGKRWHIKNECPTLQKKNIFKIKGKQGICRRRWQWNKFIFIGRSCKKALMVSHHSSDEEHEVSNFEIDDRPSYDEL